MNPFPFLCLISAGVLAGALCALWWVMERRHARAVRTLWALHPPAKPAVRWFVRRWTPTTPENMAAAFREWPESDARFRALWDLLSKSIEDELADVEAQTKSTAATQQWSGRLQSLLLLRTQILHLRQTRES